MKYKSTRGQVKGLSFEEALCSGFASDGGMLLPETIPAVTTERLKEWGEIPTYRSLASAIIPLFIGDEMSTQELEYVLDKAFSSFSCPEMIPIRHLSNNLNIAELFHGQTLSFKDYAMSVVGQLLEHFLSRSRKHETILIATSGDTGSSAISAVRGMKWLDVIVFLPKGRCSQLQELQMTTAIDDNVHVFRADGCSDDMDTLFGKVYAEHEFVKRHNISSLNSVNWARIMVQIVHYFYLYLQFSPGCDEELEVVIPTGGCGNITAGLISIKMGLPIKLVGVVNENDIVHRMVKTGNFSMKPCIPTISPSIDIQVPYNMERIWSLLTHGDDQLVDKLFQEFTRESRIQLPSQLQDEVKKYLDSFTANENLIKATIKRCHQENDYLICPHTAVAVSYHYHQISENSSNTRKRVIIATASPEKFPETLKLSGVPMETSENIKQLYKLPTKFTDIEQADDWLKILKDRILQIDEKISKQ